MKSKTRPWTNSSAVYPRRSWDRPVSVLDTSRSSLAGAIVYMFQIAGGSIDLGPIPRITLSNTNFADGISIAFLIDAIIALCSAAIALLFLGGTLDCEKLMAAWPHKHRVHA
jgi:hypothetical protein